MANANVSAGGAVVPGLVSGVVGGANVNPFNNVVQQAILPFSTNSSTNGQTTNNVIFYAGGAGNSSLQVQVVDVASASEFTNITNAVFTMKWSNDGAVFNDFTNTSFTSAITAIVSGTVPAVGVIPDMATPYNWIKVLLDSHVSPCVSAKINVILRQTGAAADAGSIPPRVNI